MADPDLAGGRDRSSAETRDVTSPPNEEVRKPMPTSDPARPARPRSSRPPGELGAEQLNTAPYRQVESSRASAEAESPTLMEVASTEARDQRPRMEEAVRRRAATTFRSAPR